MSNLGSLFYSVFLKDMTDAEFKKINDKFKNLGYEIKLTPKILKEMTQDAVPKGIKIELDPSIKSEALQKAAEGKTMKVAVTPLLTGFREAIVKATRENPPQAEVCVQETKLRSIIQNVLNKQGFMLNVSTVNDNYSKAIQQRLNGRTYTIKIHADAKEISRSVQASLMQVQSRYFGLQVSKDILRNSIDQALMGKPFPIQIAVMPDQARRAVQNALNNARMVGKDDALAYQRLQTGELKAAQAELMRLKAAQQGAASAAKTHATASVNLGGALGRNITIAGELSSAMASLYSIHAAKQFLSQVIEIGGELEHQKIALETIYGSESKMVSLYGQIKGLARQSPFGVMELTKNIKQLSAYGVAYNEVYDTAKRLADISAATSVDIQRLILAFGKTKNRTFLDGLEAKQFAYANIPIYDALSKKLTELEGKFVSVKDVMGRIKKREIGFDMVKEILWDMTDEGGKFYNMQEKLAGSVKTSWKLVRDNIELMFGEIAEGPVGSGLKSVAEILQGLTREWKTVSAVVATGAIGLGIYKVATLGVNAAVQKGTIATYNDIIAKKQKNAEELKAWGRITQLNRAELMRIATANKLTNADLRLALTEGKLTDKHIAQLFWQKKITAEQVKYLASIGMLNPAMTKAILSNNKFTLSLQMLKGRLMEAGAAMKAFLLNPWTISIAAISAVVGIVEKYNDETKKAKETGDGLFTKSSEGADNLKKSLADLKPAQGLSTLELEQGIEQMQQAIKDYSPTPIKDINDALNTQDGHVLSLTEKYEALKKKVEELKGAFETIQSNGYAEVIENAVSDTLNGISDSLEQNMEDYDDALKLVKSNLRSYAKDHLREIPGIIKQVSDSSTEFSNAIKNMTSDYQKFEYLALHYTEYMGAMSKATKDAIGAATNGNFFNQGWQEIRHGGLGKGGAGGMLNDAYKQMKDDAMRMSDSILVQIGKTKEEIAKLPEAEQKALAISIRHAIDQMEKGSITTRVMVAEMVEKEIGTTLIEDKITPVVTEQFVNAMNNATDVATKEAVKNLRHNGWNSLSDAEKELIEKLWNKAKAETMNALPDMHTDIQNWFSSNPLTWGVNIYLNDTTSKVGEAHKALTDRIGVPRVGVDDWYKKWDTDGTASTMRSNAKNKRKDLLDEYEAEVKLSGKESQRAKQIYADLKAVEEAITGAGWEDLFERKKDPKTKGSQKDEFAESLKQRFKDIKDAYSMYKEWAKLEDGSAALKRVGESGLFSTLAPDKVPQTVEQYLALIDELEKELKAAGIKGKSQRESLANELIKERFGINKDVFKEELQKALDKVSKEAERQIADWNLFDKIRKATGNQDLAMSIAFGMNTTAETDYPAMVKKQFADLAKELGHDLTFDNTTLEEARKLGDDIAKSYQDTASKLEKYARDQKDAIADILNEYQSLQDKLTKIDADRERKIKTVRESDMAPGDKQRYIQRINVEADYQKFTQSNEYLQFFGGVYALTMQQAQQIGDLIEENLNRKLQAGAISAEDYYKEIERVRQQLDKLRNVKSNALTFMTEGLKGLNKKEQEENDSKRLETIQKIKDLEEQVAEAKAKVKGIDDTEGHGAVMQADAQLNAAKKELEIQNAIRDKLIKNQEKMANMLGVVNVIANIAQGMSDAFNTLRDMADSFGFDTDSDAWNTAEAVMDTLTTVTGGVQKVLQSLLNGDIGGVVSGVFDTLLTPFTIWSKLHDKKLEKDIERSKKQQAQYEHMINAIERRMTNFLGNPKYSGEYANASASSGGAYGAQRDLMQKQLAEMERQKADMEAMKKKDPEAIADLEDQIDEMRVKIQEFAMETAKDLYGIDLKDWASQLGDALFDAWKKGEDGAEAFRKKAGDIIGQVMNNIFKLKVLEPMMQKLADDLFGKDGEAGIFGKDFELTSDEVLDYMADGLMGIVGAADDFNDFMDGIEGKLSDKYGLSMKGDSDTTGNMTKGLQSLTENTGDLLASYVNAVRGDTSVIRMYWDRLLQESLPQMNVIAEAQLSAQRQIAENTLRTAEAAEAILKSNQQIHSLFARVTQGAAKFYVN